MHQKLLRNLSFIIALLQICEQQANRLFDISNLEYQLLSNDDLGPAAVSDQLCSYYSFPNISFDAISIMK
jgi:hypothetical protein